MKDIVLVPVRNKVARGELLQAPENKSVTDGDVLDPAVEIQSRVIRFPAGTINRQTITIVVIVEGQAIDGLKPVRERITASPTRRRETGVSGLLQ